MNKKLANTTSKTILWVDLEMTGLDPKLDRIMEIAAIVTDWDFNEIATFEAAVKVTARLVQKRMKKGPAADFWNTIPATRDAIIKQSQDEGHSASVVESDLLAFIDHHFDKKLPVILAGNSIHMDRRFINSEWPRLDARLHYRMLDVTAWKLVFEATSGKRFTKPEAHRALDDIRGSIDEMKYYLAKIRR